MALIRNPNGPPIVRTSAGQAPIQPQLVASGADQRVLENLTDRRVTEAGDVRVLDG